MSENKYNCIVVLGPTASGKTRLACRIGYELNGEIISADSRQVYKYLNIGTGKDLEEYNIQGKKIPFHLIDICEPDQQFFLHDFIRECQHAFEDIQLRKKIPVICGGTGLYLDSLHKDFSYTQIPEDITFRLHAETLTKDQLISLLNTYPEHLRSHADPDSKKRIIRAIEIASFLAKHPDEIKPSQKIYKPFYIGINVSKEERVGLISSRLLQRLESGLIQEAESLLKLGITHERLRHFGLEYKFLSFYLKGELSFDEMKLHLQTAIIQFSKRQMTWFRKMEKEGIKIHWAERDDDPSKLISLLKKIF